jgi:hypothetical protein
VSTNKFFKTYQCATCGHKPPFCEACDEIHKRRTPAVNLCYEFESRHAEEFFHRVVHGGTFLGPGVLQDENRPAERVLDDLLTVLNRECCDLTRWLSPLCDCPDDKSAHRARLLKVPLLAALICSIDLSLAQLDGQITWPDPDAASLGNPHGGIYREFIDPFRGGR